MEYVEGGSENEITLTRNRTAFDDIALIPRTLVDVGTRDLSVELFGVRQALPFVIAPTGGNGMLHHRADYKLAAAAASAGIPFTLSTVSTALVEDLAAETAGAVWFQIYNMRNREFWHRLVGRADRAGCQALVLTTDVPVYGNREWDLRSYVAPAQLSWRSKLEVLRRPRWLLDVMLLHGQPRFENLAEILPGNDTRAVKGAKYVGDQLDPSLNWDDVSRLRDQWKKPFLLKGLLAPEDAEHARRIGVDGIVLSNHGGRQLDGAVTAIDVLPEIAAAVGRDLTILIDGGIRRGTDVAKALALGARAVMLGRATLYGVSAGGEAGARHAIEILRKEFDRTMALVGCATTPEIGPHLVRAARAPLACGGATSRRT